MGIEIDIAIAYILGSKSQKIYKRWLKDRKKSKNDINDDKDKENKKPDKVQLEFNFED